MITFFTILTKRSGLGNYYRSKEIYKQLMDVTECEFYLYTDRDYIEYVDLDVKTLTDPFEIKQIISDIIVYDFPFFDDIIVQILSSVNAGCVISLNDATLQKIIPDVYFNTDDLVEIPCKTEAYLGLQYQIIRDDLKRKIVDISKIQTIGVMFGGSDPANLTLKFLQQLREADELKKYNFKVLVSEKNYLEISNKIEMYQLNNIIIELAPNMASYYSSIDALINMGGMSTYEAMYVGIPVFSIEWEYMGVYVRSLSQRNLICNLGVIEKAVEKLEECLKNNVSSDLEIQIKKAQNILDGNGAKKIAVKIQEILGELN